MGCSEVKDKDVPELICQFESQNEKQKMYCIKLKDKLIELKPAKTCKWVIFAKSEIPFSIKLKIKEKVNEIQSIFDDSEEQLNKALDEIIKHLGLQNPQNPENQQNPQTEQQNEANKPPE